jgi:hypothetical protein
MQKRRGGYKRGNDYIPKFKTFVAPPMEQMIKREPINIMKVHKASTPTTASADDSRTDSQRKRMKKILADTAKGYAKRLSRTERMEKGGEPIR